MLQLLLGLISSVQIDVYVERNNDSMTNNQLHRHQRTDEYLHKELRVANDSQYSAVLVNHPNTTSMTSLCSDSYGVIYDRSHLGLVLLQEMDLFLWNMGHVTSCCDATDVLSNPSAEILAKNLLVQCMWLIDQGTRIQADLPGRDSYPTPSFFDVLDVIHSRDDMFGVTFLDLMRQHFQKITVQKRPLFISKRLGPHKIIKFVNVLMTLYLRPMIIEYEFKVKGCLSFLPNDATEFYQNELDVLQQLGFGPNSMLYGSIDRWSTPTSSFVSVDGIRGISEKDIISERLSSLSSFRSSLNEIGRCVSKIDYYLSAGRFLLHVRVAGMKGKVAMLCDPIMLTTEWLQVIPIIAGRKKCKRRNKVDLDQFILIQIT